MESQPEGQWTVAAMDPAGQVAAQSAFVSSDQPAAAVVSDDASSPADPAGALTGAVGTAAATGTASVSSSEAGPSYEGGAELTPLWVRTAQIVKQLLEGMTLRCPQCALPYPEPESDVAIVCGGPTGTGNGASTGAGTGTGIGAGTGAGSRVAPAARNSWTPVSFTASAASDEQAEAPPVLCPGAMTVSDSKKYDTASSILEAPGRSEADGCTSHAAACADGTQAVAAEVRAIDPYTSRAGCGASFCGVCHKQLPTAAAVRRHHLAVHAGGADFSHADAAAGLRQGRKAMRTAAIVASLRELAHQPDGAVLQLAVVATLQREFESFTLLAASAVAAADDASGLTAAASSLLQQAGVGRDDFMQGLAHSSLSGASAAAEQWGTDWYLPICGALAFATGPQGTERDAALAAIGLGRIVTDSAAPAAAPQPLHVFRAVTQRLVAALQVHVRGHSAAAMLCWALTIMIGQASNQTLLTASPAIITRFVEALRLHPDHRGIAQMVFGAMRTLTAGNADLKHRLVRAGALPLIVASLQCNLGDEVLVEAACGTLRNLATDAEVKVQLRFMPAVPPLMLSVLDFYAHKIELARLACAVLCNLAAQPEVAETFMRTGGVALVLGALACHQDDAGVVEVACGTLHNVNNTPQEEALQGELLQMNAAPLFVSLLQRHGAGDSWRLALAICRLLAFLAGHPVVQPRLAAAHAVPALLSTLRRHLADERIVAAAGGVLLELSVTVEQQAPLAEAGAIAVVVSFQRRHQANAAVVAIACMILHNHVAQRGGCGPLQAAT